MKCKRLMVALAIGWTIIGKQGSAQQYNEAYFDSLVQSKAQSLVARTSKFMVTGTINSGITFTKDANTFSSGIAPIFLWKPAERLAVEAEFETELEGTGTTINLEYADVAYTINKYMTIRAGKFLSPFGIYQDRLHPEWINKLPSIPLGFDHDNAPVMPTSEIGVDLRGAIPLGSAKMNYSVYVSNGPSLNTTDAEQMGQLIYGSAEDNNKNKALGGRIGLLPFSNSSLEIGGSAQFARIGDQGSIYQNVATRQYALDLIYSKQLDFLRGYLDIKGQWDWVNVDNVIYKDPADTTGNTTFSFKNQRNAGFGQLAYRPTMSQNKFLKKTELIFRYSGLNLPSNLGEASQLRQYTYGITYWYTWRTAFKLAWQSQADNNAFYVQVALGF